MSLNTKQKITLYQVLALVLFFILTLGNEIFDFELDESDMKMISTLDLNITQFPEWE